MKKRSYGIIGVSIISIFIISVLVISEERPSKDDLYSYALKIVNDDRKIHNVPPVVLSNITSAQNHANDMLQANYFSHWNTEGVKPYVTYTKLGGRGNIDENIAESYNICETPPICSPILYDPFKEIKDAEYGMMYNDSESDWGHRDNIVDPYHTHVNFGIVYDENNFYFVEHFEDNIVKWKSIRLANSTLIMIGTIPSNFSFLGIDIYEDPPAKKLSDKTLNTEPPYNLTYYDSGTPIGLIIGRSTYSEYQQCPDSKIGFYSDKGIMCTDYVFYDNKSEDSGVIDISADISKWLGKEGLHTIYVALQDENGNMRYATSLTLEYLK